MNEPHGGNLDLFSKKYNTPISRVKDFSSNTNRFIYQSKINSLIKRNIKKLFYYPDINYTRLKKAFSSYTSVKEKYIVPLNGAAEGITCVFKDQNWKKIIICAPEFQDYETIAAAMKIKICFFNTGASDFNINIKKLISFCLEVKPSAVIITNPNNPSGRLVKKEEIIFLLLALKQKNIYLMVDESFMEFSGTNESVLAAVPEYKNLIVIKSFTKYFGVPGLRSGALFLREKEKIITPSWNINSLSAAAAAEIAVRPGNYIKPPAVFFRAKNKFFSALKDIKEIKVYPSNADFFLCRILTRLTARGLYGKLAARRIKIRDCGNFHGLNKKYFRVTVKTEKENGYFLKHLKEALGGK